MSIRKNCARARVGEKEHGSHKKEMKKCGRRNEQASKYEKERRCIQQTHTNTLTHTHTHSHTHIKEVRECGSEGKRDHALKYINTQTHTCTHIRTHTQPHIHTNTLRHTHTHT